MKQYHFPKSVIEREERSKNQSASPVDNKEDQTKSDANKKGSKSSREKKEEEVVPRN